MGPSPPPEKRGTPPIFVPCVLRPNGWMDQDATWYEGMPRPMPHCVRRGTSSPEKGIATTRPALFGPCLLCSRSPISATAERLPGEDLDESANVLCRFWLVFHCASAPTKPRHASRFNIARSRHRAAIQLAHLPTPGAAENSIGPQNTGQENDGPDRTGI